MGDPRFDIMDCWGIDSLAINEYLLEKRDAVQATDFGLGVEQTNSNVPVVFIASNKEHRDNILHYMALLNDSDSAWNPKLFDDANSSRQWISETLGQ